MEKASLLYRLRELFRIFFVISLVTLGGGLAMLPAMREELVEKRKWVTDEEMMDTVAAMQSMPGIIACNIGVLLGYRVAGVAGAFCALAGAVLPPFLAIVVLASLVAKIRTHEAVSHLFLGVRAGVAALILYASVSLAKQVFQGKEGLGRTCTWIVAAASFVCLAFLGANAVLVLLASAVLGWILSLWIGRRGKTAAEATTESSGEGGR